MKKLIPLALVATILSGCGSNQTYLSSVTDGTTALVEIDGTTITTNDIYRYYLESYGSSQVLDFALTHIAEIEITDQDAIDAKLQETIDTYTTYAGVDLNSYAVSLGYESGDQYTQEALLPSVLQQLLIEKYVNDNVATLKDEYKIKYLKTVSFNTEIEATDFISSTTNEDFDTAMIENDGIDVGIVTSDNTDLDTNIIGELDSFTQDGIYQEVISTTDGKFVVVYIYNTELDDDSKSEVISTLMSTDGISAECEKYYLDKYDFTVNEPLIKQAIDATYATE